MAMMISTILLLFTFLHDPSEAIHHLEKRQLVTCPGFAGYCSESYPGGVCTVVCAFGRPNVPECQADGTWTDIPRCIEHEPGKETQIPGFCPGIPGYCSDDRSGGVCEFDCLIGPDIRSFCTPDGTWEPYPTCDGDIRDTRDGCDGCPGEFGGARNRTAEAAGGGKKKQGGSRAGPAQPARAAAARPSGRPQASSAARPAKRPANNRRGQGQKKNQGSRRRNQGAKRPSGNGKRPTAQASRPQRPKRPQAPRQQASPVAPRQQPKQQRPTQQALVKSQPKAQKTSSGGASNKASGGRTCPGGSLEMCIDVCPSFSARIFGACVGGCAKRCPSKK